MMPTKQQIARLISRIFDPVIIVPLILFGVVSLGMVNGYNWQFLVFILVVDALIPGIYVFARFMKKGKDWDIKSRQERIPLFFLTVMSHALGVLMAYKLGIQPLGIILLGLWLLAVIFAVVTLKWKISVHAGVNSVLAVFVIYFFGWDYWWIWMIPVLVSWARVQEHFHDRAQVVAGLLIPPVFLYLFYGWIGILN